MKDKRTLEQAQDELGENLCTFCRCTDYGSAKINTGPWNLCEGCACEEAYENYLENHEEEGN